MKKHSDELASYGFTNVAKILTPNELSDIANHCTKRVWSSAAAQETNQKLGPEKNTRSVYADPKTEQLLDSLRPKLELISNKTLIPTYSFFRFYPQNTGLGKHIDRPACEYTLTVCLQSDYSNLTDSDPEYAWPIYIDGTPCVTEPGDAILYKGHELVHWRRPLKGKFQLQLFLHYVDANGQFAEQHAYDKRTRLNMD